MSLKHVTIKIVQMCQFYIYIFVKNQNVLFMKNDYALVCDDVPGADSGFSSSFSLSLSCCC